MILNAKTIIKSWQERSEENKKKRRDKHFPVMRFRLVIISVSL
jgi:hypothetical protein